MVLIGPARSVTDDEVSSNDGARRVVSRPCADVTTSVEAELAIPGPGIDIELAVRKTPAKRRT
jgi:hypothetical protein